MIRPHKLIGVAVIWNAQKSQILIDRRLPKGELGGYWEFPGGKIEEAESVIDCIKREINEELGIEIEVGDRLITINHDYRDFRVTLFVHNCYYVSGTPQPIECDEVRWVSIKELEQYQFPAGNLEIIKQLSQF